MEAGVKNKGFKRAYGQLKHDDAITSRQVLMNRNDWSPSLFGLKKSGKRGMTPIEQDRVSTVFRTMGIDWETGEPITNLKSDGNT